MPMMGLLLPERMLGGYGEDPDGTNVARESGSTREEPGEFRVNESSLYLTTSYLYWDSLWY